MMRLSATTFLARCIRADPSPSIAFRAVCTGLAVALLLALPGASAAQSCLGFALQEGQHSLGWRFDDRIDGGFGGWYAGLRREGISTSLNWSFYDIENFDDEAESQLGMIMDLRTALPVLRSASVAGKPSGPCAVVEVGGSSFYGVNSSSIGAGLGYSLGTDRGSAFAGPVLGMAFAGGANSSYVNVLAAGSTRMGPVLLGAEALLPLLPEGAQVVLAVRLGFAWGKATPVAAGPAPAVGPAASTRVPEASGTAGLKPYSLEDVEAMIRNGVTTVRILDLASPACVSFRVNDETETRLRRVGADQQLIEGLRQRCYTAP